MRSYKTLIVWQRAHKLVLEVYKTTDSFPVSERYGLTSQIRRAAVSIPANIAEGCSRGTDLDTAHFFQIGLGSAAELSYELLLARDLGFMSDDSYQSMVSEVEEISRMLNTLAKQFRGNG
jgi:four helix bundle protein